MLVENWTLALLLILCCCTMKCNSSVDPAISWADIGRRYVDRLLQSQVAQPGLRNNFENSPIESGKSEGIQIPAEDSDSRRNISYRRFRRLLQHVGPLEHFEGADDLPDSRIDDGENLIPADENDPFYSTEPEQPLEPYHSSSKKRVFPAVAIVFLLIGLSLFILACYVSDGQILHADNKTMCWLIMGSGFEV